MSERPKEDEWWIYESSTDRVVTRKHKFAELSVNYEPTERLYTESDIKAKDARIGELEGFIGRFLYDAPGISDKVEKILAKGGE